MRSWGGDPSLNTKFVYVSYIPYTHGLKIILCDIFSGPVFAHDLSHEVICGHFHCDTLLAHKKSGISDFTFWGGFFFLYHFYI
jgi:hypothetical protein